MPMRELADRAQVTVRTVLRISQGKSLNPGVGTIADLARALDVRPAWLAYGDGAGPSD